MKTASRQSITVKHFGWASLALVLLLSLEFQLHELSHHFMSAALCHRFGTVSFDYYESAHGCSVVKQDIAEVFGPFVSLCLAYGGAIWLLQKRSIFAFCMIFASYFHLRYIPPLLGGGDEADLARKLQLAASPWLLAVTLFALSVFPLWTAWRSLSKRRRLFTFSLAYLLPLPFVWYANSFASWISGSKAVFPRLARLEFLHIPLSLLLWDFAALLAFALLVRLRGRQMNAFCDY